jgi:uncharacterized protein with HEPN domain
MSEIPVNVVLQDMMDCIDNIAQFIAGLDYAGYSNDVKTKSAVERNLEIIGEAANRLPNTLWLKYPEIEWRRIVSLRNRLIHGYFETNDEIIWDVINTFLPPLKERLAKMLSQNLS